MTVEVGAEVRVNMFPSSGRLRIDEDGEAIAVDGRECRFDATRSATKRPAANDYARGSAEAVELEERCLGLTAVEESAKTGGVVRGYCGRGDGRESCGAIQELRRSILSPTRRA